jgi:dienelactone hydrolase
MITRNEVEFDAGGGLRLRGWLFVPSTRASACPAITMAHGFAGVKEHRLEAYATAFAESGFVVLVHEHRNFGASDGTPRNDINPWQQIADWRRAISFLESQDCVIPQKIGLWGSSYSGGHAIVLGATDRRLRCVVAQVPTINGYEQSLRRVAPDKVATLEELFSEDERALFRGEPPRTQAVVSMDPSVPAAYRAEDAHDFYLMPAAQASWENSIAIRSSRAARMYEPGTWVSRISPTPLLMIVATHDEGGHFDPYVTLFERSSGAALEWFLEHLR